MAKYYYNINLLQYIDRPMSLIFVAVELTCVCDTPNSTPEAERQYRPLLPPLKSYIVYNQHISFDTT